MHTSKPYLLPALEKIVAFFLLAYPSAFLLIKGGMNGILFLTVLFAIAVRLFALTQSPSAPSQKEWCIYFIAMFGLTLAIFFSQIANNMLMSRPYDAASRFWLAIASCWLFLRLRANIFTTFQYAFPIAAILCWAFSVPDPTGEGVSLPSLNRILFGDYLILFGVLSFFSIDWFQKDSTPVRLLKWIGFIIGLIASFQSAARGALLVIPVVIVIYIYFWHGRFSPKTLIASILLGGAILGGAFMGSQTVHERMEKLSSDIAAYQHGDRDTSTGVRWQLNIAAIKIFLAHPLTGVGPEIVGGAEPDGFAREIKKMYEEGQLSKYAADVGICCQTHNEVLAKAADLGIFGLTALLALYFVPFYFFWNATKKPDPVIKRAGILGITFVSCHFIFGMTVGLLGLTMTAAFYGFTVAILLAACYSSRSEQTSLT